MKESKDIYEFLDRYKTNPFRKVDRSLILLLGADSPWGLYMVMRFATPDDGLCLFSRKGLSRMLKISLSTVKKYIIELQQLGLIEGLNSEPTEKGFRLLPLNYDKIKEKLLAEGLNSEPRKGAKKRTTGGLKNEPQGGQKMNQQVKENSLQHLESIPEISTNPETLLDLYLLDQFIRSNKQINNCAHALEIFLRIKPKRENYRKYTQLSDDSRHAIDGILVDLFPESLPCLKSFITYHIWVLIDHYAEQHEELFQKALVNFERLLQSLQADESLEKLTRYMVQQYMYICFDKSEYYHKFIESGQSYKWHEKYHRKIYDKLAIVGNSFVDIYRSIIANSD